MIITTHAHAGAVLRISPAGCCDDDRHDLDQGTVCSEVQSLAVMNCAKSVGERLRFSVQSESNQHILVGMGPTESVTDISASSHVI